MSSEDEPIRPKKVAYQLPTKVDSYRLPSIRHDVSIVPVARLPEDPDVPSSGWFDAARVESKLLRTTRRKKLWSAVTELVYQHRAFIAEWEQYQVAITRASNIETIVEDYKEEFELEMKLKKHRRDQIRKQLEEEKNPKPVAEPPKLIPEDPMARHRKAIHDMIMLPQKIRAEAEQFIRDEIITKRGGKQKTDGRGQERDQGYQ